jgi:hypothetical protein
MTSLKRKPKSASSESACIPFRFNHHGVTGYAALLTSYREQFKISQAQLVRLTGFSPRSVAKWAAGDAPSEKQEKVLVELDRLLVGLARVMEPAQVGRWLVHPNPAFDGSPPMHVMERGEQDRLWRMLYDIESGQPG